MFPVFILTPWDMRFFFKCAFTFQCKATSHHPVTSSNYHLFPSGRSPPHALLKRLKSPVINNSLVLQSQIWDFCLEAQTKSRTFEYGWTLFYTLLSKFHDSDKVLGPLELVCLEVLEQESSKWPSLESWEIFIKIPPVIMSFHTYSHILQSNFNITEFIPMLLQFFKVQNFWTIRQPRPRLWIHHDCLEPCLWLPVNAF